MLTPEEKQEIIDLAVEKTLAVMPEVVGNLMKAKALESKLVADFYEAHEEFQPYKEIVQEIVSKVEGQDPTMPYDEVLSKSVPKIKKAIEQRKKVDMDMPERKNLDLSFKTDPILPDNGEI